MGNHSSPGPRTHAQSQPAPPHETGPGPTALETALWAIDRGLWPVLITPIDDKAAASPGKQPIGKAWGKERHDAQWWRASLRRHRTAGVGPTLGRGRRVIGIGLS